ncbi:MAG: phage major capsid protein [Betaproteobacteria bacterium]
MKRIPAQGVVGIAALREAATTELYQVMNLVRAALQAWYDARKPANQSMAWFDIEAMYAERVIACKDGRYWSFAYTIDEKNNVQLADPVEVVEEFKPVSMREALAGNDAEIREAAGSEGKVWEVILVRAGQAKSSNVFYPDRVLREAAGLFEGARCYVKVDEEHLKKDVKDPEKIFGWFSDVKFVEGAKADTGHLAARLNVAAGMSALRETIVDAWKRGKKDLVALSINAYGKIKEPLRRGAARIAESIRKVSSVDLIVEPGAGGALVRLVEAADDKEQDPMKDKMLAAIKAKFPNLDVSAMSDEQILQRYAEAVRPAPAPANDRAGDPLTREEFAEYRRLTEARAAARAKIGATTLPQPSKDVLVARFEKLARFTEADVDTEIKAERDQVVRLLESQGVDAGKVKLAAGDIQVEDRSKRVAHMLDAFFNPGGKDAEGKPYPAVASFKECYIEMTGDRRVTGRIEHMDRSRLAEACGAAFRESLDTAGLTNVLGSSIRRRMIADYREHTAWDAWRLACERVPVADFRTNERTRIGGYGNLPAVNQGAAYQALGSPTDEKATYAATKRGGTEDMTLEAIKNDDVGLIRRIPVALARSAKRTVCEFVLDFVRTNPAIYDGVAFFHANHANLGAAALDATSLAARRLAMKKQTELNSAKRIGVGPRYLWVPDDLEETGVNLFNRNTNNDKTFVQQLSLTVVPVPYWTDANDWALSADVSDIPGIEVGFLDGNEEPELFVQDNPTVGSMFSNDKLTWKIRHIYGGNVKDFRSWDKSVVA